MARTPIRANTSPKQTTLGTSAPDAQAGWKNHPIAIFSTGFVAATTLCVLLFTQVVLPTQTAALANQIAELPELRKLISEAKKKFTELEGKLAEANKKLAEFEYANLFSAGNPYPLGLGNVRIGDPITTVASVYTEGSIKRNDDGYWSVRGQHSLFNEVTYYYDEDSSKKAVTHISFDIVPSMSMKDLFYGKGEFKPMPPKNFLQAKLIEAFGSPNVWARKEHYSWDLGAKGTIYKLNGLGYVLMRNDQKPGYWPKS